MTTTIMMRATVPTETNTMTLRVLPGLFDRPGVGDGGVDEGDGLCDAVTEVFPRDIR